MYREAETLHRRALAISEKTLGPDHPAVAANLTHYARLLRAMKRKAEASKLEKRARAILAFHAQENLANLTVDISELGRR